VARIPTAVAVRHLTDSLRALGEAPAKGRPLRIDDLEDRLLWAIERDRSGTAVRDGYAPARAIGGGGRGGPVVAVDDGNGVIELIPATGVEASVFARIDPDDHQVVRDRHHELTARAARAVEDAVVAIQIARSALDSIDDLTKPAGPPAPKTCAHCTGKRGAGGDRPIYVRGTVGDRLSRSRTLCAACYWFVWRASDAGSRADILPTDEQITDHELRGRWRIRVVDRKRQNQLGPGQR
jgi:hypothetical protein